MYIIIDWFANSKLRYCVRSFEFHIDLSFKHLKTNIYIYIVHVYCTANTKYDKKKNRKTKEDASSQKHR